MALIINCSNICIACVSCKLKKHSWPKSCPLSSNHSDSCNVQMDPVYSFLYKILVKKIKYLEKSCCLRRSSLRLSWRISQICCFWLNKIPVIVYYRKLPSLFMNSWSSLNKSFCKILTIREKPCKSVTQCEYNSSSQSWELY